MAQTEYSHTGPDSISKEFISSFSIPNSIIKKDDCSDSNQDFRLETFNVLNRQSSIQAVKTKIKNMIGQALKCGQEGFQNEECQYLVDIFVIVFYFRDYQYGPGNRDISYWMILELWTYFPETSLKCLSLFQDYGGWMDFLKILDIIRGKYLLLDNSAFRKSPEYLQLKKIEDVIFDICVNQMKIDTQKINQKKEILAELKELETSKDTFFSNLNHKIREKYASLENFSISLWGKWCPAENGQYHWIAHNLASRLYGHLPMYSKDGDVIGPSLNESKQNLNNNVSSSAKNYKKALRHCFKLYRKDRVELNRELQTCELLMSNNNWELIQPQRVPVKCFKKNKETFLDTNQPMTNRLECSLNFRKYLESTGVVFKETGRLGNIIRPYLYYEHSHDSRVESQWNQIITDLNIEAPIDNIILIPDFSIEKRTHYNEELLGLFLMIDQILFSNRDEEGEYICPTNNSKCFSLKNNYSLQQKIDLLKNTLMFGETDLKDILELILKRTEITNKTQIIILSDKEFNNQTWKQIDSIFTGIAQLKSKLNIIYWTFRQQPLNIKYLPFNNIEIQLINSFNYFILKYLLKPQELRCHQHLIFQILNSPRYNKIREICNLSQENKLSNYKFKSDWIEIS